jgi:alpha-L-fucosidase
MLRYLVNNTSMGGNSLLNVGPKADGTLPAPAVRRLREMGAWLDVNGEAVFGSEPSGLAMPEGVYSTCKETSEGKNLYLFLTRPMTSVTVPAVLSGECKVVETGQPVGMTVLEDETVITLPENLFKDDSIIVLKCRL